MTETVTRNIRCSYCSIIIENDQFLECEQCNGCVHIKCLRRASTPGDLLGDTFFDFTCAKCEQLYCNAPSTSSQAKREASEKFVRKRMPWLLVIVLALYNLSIKSKGLGHHGYFHWRTHIIGFIDKNWDYLFEPKKRRRKNWIGSVSGALSHNSPDFFTSGLDVFNEQGWWKLTHENQTPKSILRIYEKRTQFRPVKLRQHDENSCGSDFSNSTSETVVDVKRMRLADSIDNLLPIDSCSRTLPYMGRKPKPDKTLNIVNDNVDTNTNHLKEQEQEPFNAVQSSLMDFLAENLVDDDLNIFNSLPNISAEPLIGVGKDDFLIPHSPLLDASNNDEVHFFDAPDLKAETSVTDFNILETNTVNSKLKGLIAEQNTKNEETMQSLHNYSLKDNAQDVKVEFGDDDTVYDDDNVDDDDEDENSPYRPRIVQIINFQQLETTEKTRPRLPTIFNNNKIKEEPTTDAENEENDKESTAEGEIVVDNPAAVITTLPPCKPSLFSKQTRRKWPWLIERPPEDDETSKDLNLELNNCTRLTNENLAMMSAYEEQQMLRKLKKIITYIDNEKPPKKLEVPAYIRRFYRKLCIRKDNRDHGRPVFNIDNYLYPQENKLRLQAEQQTQIIDRFQLISLSNQEVRKSFYARITGSSDYEMFESPYTQRILHPFIYRNKECFPQWVKLMCELKHAVTGEVPKRSTIDFCYVRAHHIAAVNALLQNEFWPGIDMSECLSYPDYSVVALYKRLVIGCGFLVPDVGFNEAYLSFMAVRPGWQRSGIATFMLYHLIQTCMSKDITLHVSATNPAVVLYQKFGFKIEETILDFYEKYLPIDSKHSRHAFFLRLMR